MQIEKEISNSKDYKGHFLEKIDKKDKNLKRGFKQYHKDNANLMIVKNTII